MTSTDAPAIRIGFLLFPEYELLDVFGPMEMLSMANKLAPTLLHKDWAYDIITIGYMTEAVALQEHLPGFCGAVDVENAKKNPSAEGSAKMSIPTSGGPSGSVRVEAAFSIHDANIPQLDALLVPGGKVSH